MTSGLRALQHALDAGDFPSDWPANVCRDAWCGHWERMNGRYYWHTPAEHDDQVEQRSTLGGQA